MTAATPTKKTPMAMTKPRSSGSRIRKMPPRDMVVSNVEVSGAAPPGATSSDRKERARPTC